MKTTSERIGNAESTLYFEDGLLMAVSLKKAAPYIEVIAERLAEEFPGETMDEARQKAGV